MHTTHNRRAYDLKGLKILILEEFQFMADLMSSVLKEFHVGQVHATCDFTEAKRMLEEHNIKLGEKSRIDLIITDLLPPKNEGLQFISWVRSHPKESISFLPVLFCSTHTSMKTVLAGRDSGADEIMVKPMTAEKMAQRLSHIIDLPRPYVRTPVFFGPDRRRQEKEYNGSNKRAQEQDNIKVTYETE